MTGRQAAPVAGDEQVQASGQPGGEPVAVVGMGCRLPGGVGSPAGFWRLLRDGRDAIGPLDTSRWEHYRARGRDFAAVLDRTTGYGASLAGIHGFDAEFFGLSPREAELMDPQHRILLEVAWEALEDAGIGPDTLRGTDAGVFVGIGSDDYGRLQLEDLPGIEAWTGIGAAQCGAANRVSYALDLRGPSLSVDTACSSSLVALHLAADSLRRRETPVALVGGVNLMVSPGLAVTLDQAGALAADGRCKPFSAAADGYGRGEGCGVLVLKRLADAQRDGDCVHAVVLGSAVQQDGHTNGIMAPSQQAQAHLLAQACRAAGVDRAGVDYVEAHGTGTPVGDVVEAAALSTVYGAARPAGRPCLIGSAKSNIGHLEAAAGVVGVIKAVLALTHQEIPASLHARPANPAVPWATAGLAVVAEPTAWPRTGRPRRAGVSGFGYGGTIAHVIIQEAPPEAARGGAPDRPAGPGLFPLSGASPAGLRAQAAALADWLSGVDAPLGPSGVDASSGLSGVDASPGLSGVDAPLGPVGHTLARRRAHLACRAAVVAQDRPGLVAGLRALAGGRPAPGLCGPGTLPATPAGTGPGVVWVFSGHGSQWPGMGRELLASQPAFAAVIERIDPIYSAELGFSLVDAITAGELGAVDRIQSMICGLQLGLAALLAGWAGRPAAVIGHSVGEIAAAVAAGVLDVEAGARLVCRRSRLLRRVAGQGAMAMVDLPYAEAAGRLAGHPGAWAAIDAAPGSTVVSGDRDAIGSLVEQWRRDGVLVRRVDSDVAFHSPHMQPLVDELAAVAGVTPRPGERTLYSTALPDPRNGQPRDGAYWAANLRNPVRFRAAVRAAADDGHRLFVEVSPHPVVTHSIVDTLADAGLADVQVLGTLRRGQPERAGVLAAVGTLFAAGGPVDWAALHPGGTLLTLPTRAWQHAEHWRAPGHAGRPADPGHDPASHTLLGGQTRVAGAAPAEVWQTTVDVASRPCPAAHLVRGVEVLPAAVVLTTFLAAAGTTALSEVTLSAPLTVDPARQVQVVRQGSRLYLASRPAPDPRATPAPAAPDGTADQADQPWLANAAAAVGAPAAAGAPVPEPAPGCPRAGEPGEVLDYQRAVGVPAMAFPWQVEQLAHGTGALCARVAVPAGPDQAAAAGPDQAAGAAAGWAAVLDAALSIAPLAFGGPPVLRMITGLERVHLAGDPPASCAVQVTCRGPAGPRAGMVDVVVRAGATGPDGAGGPAVAWLTGVTYTPLDGDDVVAPADPDRLVHEISWRPCPPPDTGGGPRRVVLVGGDAALRSTLGTALRAAGSAWTPIPVPELLGAFRVEASPPDTVVVLPASSGATDPAAPDGTGTFDRAVSGAWLLARTAQLVADWPQPPALWCVTRGVRECADPAALAQAPLWGLARVLAGEHPELWGGLVDLDPGDPASVAVLPRLLAHCRGEDVIAVRGGSTTVARLVPHRGAPVRPAPHCTADGTYLVTGGLGTLGLAVARWLVGRGARRLVLTGRRPFPPRSRWDDDGLPAATRARIGAVRALEASGATVRVLELDAADADRTAALLAPDALGLPPIRGVVHLAGVLDDRMAADLDAASLRGVMRPKAAGALVLHQLFPPGTLDFFVLFSSAGLLLGIPGQSSYASANAFLDGLARHRAGRGDRGALSLGFTSWRGLGMAVSAVVDMELRARGTAAISPDEAFAAWDYASRRDTADVAVLRTTALPDPSAGPPLLRELEFTASADQPATEPSPESPPAVDDLRRLAPEQLAERLVAEVAGQVAAEMKLAAADIDIRRPLVDLGLDSVMFLIVRRRLAQRFRLDLPATLLWTRPTVAAIADYLGAALRPADAAVRAPGPAPGSAAPAPAGATAAPARP